MTTIVVVRLEINTGSLDLFSSSSAHPQTNQFEMRVIIRLRTALNWINKMQPAETMSTTSLNCSLVPSHPQLTREIH